MGPKPKYQHVGIPILGLSGSRLFWLAHVHFGGPTPSLLLPIPAAEVSDSEYVSATALAGGFITSIKLLDRPAQFLGGSPRLASRGTQSLTIGGLVLCWPTELAVYLLEVVWVGGGRVDGSQSPSSSG